MEEQQTALKDNISKALQGIKNEDEKTTPFSTGAENDFCPNCNRRLEGRKCKLFCTSPGCGYLVTCSEW